MRCVSCQYETASEARFCQECGTTVCAELGIGLHTTRLAGELR